MKILTFITDPKLIRQILDHDGGKLRPYVMRAPKTALRIFFEAEPDQPVQASGTSKPWVQAGGGSVVKIALALAIALVVSPVNARRPVAAS